MTPMLYSAACTRRITAKKHFLSHVQFRMLSNMIETTNRNSFFRDLGKKLGNFYSILFTCVVIMQLWHVFFIGMYMQFCMRYSKSGERNHFLSSLLEIAVGSHKIFRIYVIFICFHSRCFIFEPFYHLNFVGSFDLCVYFLFHVNVFKVIFLNRW